MLSLPPSVRLFVATSVVDGRKGPDSLMTFESLLPDRIAATHPELVVPDFDEPELPD